MRLKLALIALTLVCAPTAMAQPLPSTIASSRLTQAQEAELGRRLSALQGRFNTLAGETRLREAAVRNIAIEIFGAQPNLEFETYSSLIESGARELRSYVTQARARTDHDPDVANLRERAIATAEEGRLKEARALYDRLLAANRASRQRARDTEDLADAALLAESAELAYAAADFHDAARRYGQAADLTPESASSLRFHYRYEQALKLSEAGERLGDRDDLVMAVDLLERTVLPLAQDDLQRGDAQYALGYAMRFLGERGDESWLRRSAEAHRTAIQYAEAGSEGWAVARLGLGGVLLRIGERGRPEVLTEAIAELEAALTYFTPARDLDSWAMAKTNIASSYLRLSRGTNVDLLEQAVAGYNGVFEFLTAEAGGENWAGAKTNLGVALIQLARAREDITSFDQAIVALNEALAVRTRDGDRYQWAIVNSSICSAYAGRASLSRNARDVETAVSACTAALAVLAREDDEVNWARTNVHLGNAWAALAAGSSVARTNATAAYRAAEAAFERLGWTADAQRARVSIGYWEAYGREPQ